MQNNEYQWAMVNRLTTEASAQRIYHISELEKMLTFTEWNSGMAAFSYWQGGSSSYMLFYYAGTKTMADGFTIYLL